MPKKLLLLGAAILVAATAPAANAEVLKWTLVDAVFDDGGTASGSFDFNTVTLAYTAINITTTTGTILGGNTYTVDDPLATPRDFGFGSLTSLSNNAEGDPLLDINTTTSFDMPGTVSIGQSVGMFLSSEGTCSSDGCEDYHADRSLSGEVVSTVVSVPESGTWAMMMIGFGAIGFFVRTRCQKFVFSSS